MPQRTITRGAAIVAALAAAAGVAQWARHSGRVRRVVHVVMDRPIAYKVHIKEGTVDVTRDHTLVEDVRVTMTPPMVDVQALQAFISENTSRPRAFTVYANNVTLRDVHAEARRG